MAEISAAIVKALREETGQGMMDCKKALQDTNGDVEAARDLLRKKGASMAEKKASRETKEGQVGIKTAADGKSAVMIEVQCETDFCARNDVFKQMVSDVAAIAAKCGTGEVAEAPEMSQCIQGALAKIGENMKYVRGVKIAASRIGTYLHHNGKVGVILGVEGEISNETLADLCMHIAFADPMGISPADIPAAVVEKERKFATEQAMESGKPADIAAKMVEGKMRKFLEGLALVEQVFVRDDTKKVKDVLGKAKVTAFARYSVGG